MDLDDATSIHNSPFFNTPSPHARFEAPTLVPHPFPSDVSHECRVSPQIVGFEASAYCSGNIMGPVCSHSTRHMPQLATRSGAPSRVAKRKTKSNAAEPIKNKVKAMQGGRSCKLEADVKVGAAQMRKLGACWSCKLSRETVSLSLRGAIYATADTALVRLQGRSIMLSKMRETRQSAHDEFVPQM
jgi:hypothetical protein